MSSSVKVVANGGQSFLQRVVSALFAWGERVAERRILMEMNLRTLEDMGIDINQIERRIR